MTSRILKIPRARVVALAVCVGALASFALAPAANAAVGPKPPAVGSNCQTDGKISGAGSTFQANAYYFALAYGYQQDVCGPVGSAPSSGPGSLNSAYTGDPSIFTAIYKSANAPVSGMVAYNYSTPSCANTPPAFPCQASGETAAKNGSGAGLNRISCRTDFFGGTDLPYNDAQISNINGAPGLQSGGSPPAYNCSTAITNLSTVPPPYNPSTNTYANSSDATAQAMNFPIAGGAVAVAVNLNGMCTNGTPTSLNLTSAEFDDIWQGSINEWNDATLVGTNPILSTDGCSGKITRVVRSDNSGTSGLMMQDLGAGDNGTHGIDTASSLCTNTVTSTANPSWLTLFNMSSNTTWPTKCADINDSTSIAPDPINAGTTNTGSPPLIALLKTTNGGIGYAELGLWGTLPAGVSFAQLQNAAGSAFVSPGNPGSASACNPGALGLPGSGSANESVGLGGSGDNWSSSGSTTTTNKENITYAGSGYPVCGLTFDLVYKGMDNETGESSPVTGASQTVQGPMIGATNDQLRTLYSFFTYVFSPLGQSYLDQATYDELPGAWLLPLRQGYQNNF